MTPEPLGRDDFELDIRVVAGTPAPAGAAPTPVETVLRHCFTPWCAPTLWKCPPSRQIPCRG
jgi:hypothetical protein